MIQKSLQFRRMDLIKGLFDINKPCNIILRGKEMDISKYLAQETHTSIYKNIDLSNRSFRGLGLDRSQSLMGLSHHDYYY